MPSLILFVIGMILGTVTPKKLMMLGVGLLLLLMATPFINYVNVTKEEAAFQERVKSMQATLCGGGVSALTHSNHSVHRDDIARRRHSSARVSCALTIRRTHLRPAARSEEEDGVVSWLSFLSFALL